MKRIFSVIIFCTVIFMLSGCSIDKVEDRYKMLDVAYIENDYYEVEFPFSAYMADKVISISGNVTCIEPYSEWPGLQIFRGLPASEQNIFITINERFGNGAPVRVHVDTEGNAYLRYGKAGSLYDINIMYICQ